MRNTREFYKVRLLYIFICLISSQILFVSAVYADIIDGGGSVSTSDPLNVATKKLWSSPKISVCWEEKYQNFGKEKKWVAEAVEGSWEKHSLIDFIGWGTCRAPTDGIRIKVAGDVWPHVQAFGKDLKNNKNGMQLTFTFTGKFATGCALSETQRQNCIKRIAIHEFGHALGFAHEQNRDDTPDFLVTQKDGTQKPCDEMAQGSDKDTTPFGGWDLDSVMNYCNRSWESKLSSVDIAGVQQFYGADPWTSSGDRGKGFYVGDFDGDGKDDIFRYLNKWGGAEVMLSSESQFGNPVNWSGAGDRGKGFYVGDFDGDGKDDIFRYLNKWGGAEVMLSSGSQFGSPVNWSGAGDRGKGFYVGDFDGDGKDDIFRYLNKWGGAEVMLSSGSQFGSPVNWSEAGDRGKGFYVGDFDGDGKDDIFRYVNESGGAEVMVSDGTKFKSPINWTGAGDGIHDFFIGDFNNDGKDDIARDLGPEKGVDVLISKGDGFEEPKRWVLSTAIFNLWHVGDYNGNGSSDIFRYVNEWGGAMVYLSERSKFIFNGTSRQTPPSDTPSRPIRSCSSEEKCCEPAPKGGGCLLCIANNLHCP